jgi:hypothetical protein
MAGGNKMNKKRVIALFVAFAFLSLLSASTMPLRADQAPDQAGTTVSSPEQGPSFIEEEGYGHATAKKSIVPIILIGVGVAALAAVLVLVVLKTKYDIVGAWTVSVNWTNPTITGSYTTTFTGDKKSGTCSALTNSGTYTVSGSDATWTLGVATYVGKFDTKTTISGTMSTTGGNLGTFTASKNATTASVPGGNTGAVTGEKTLK